MAEQNKKSTFRAFASRANKNKFHEFKANGAMVNVQNFKIVLK